jgi:site-specific DNA recombinase
MYRPIRNVLRRAEKQSLKLTRTLAEKPRLTAQGFGEFYKPAEARLNQLVAELPKLEAEVDFLKVNKLSADDVLHESNSLYERWPTLPTEDKRKIVEALIEKLVIGNGEIDITFSHLPSSEELCKNQQKLVS